ncbi:MAG: hypothetical protein methR_P1913 [Methyloprofundus sp.]|nr:MAG: hypothetical protein methR_P1913 [Methyloprofundus sp.]
MKPWAFILHIMPKNPSVIFIITCLVLAVNIVKAGEFSPKLSVSGFGSFAGTGTDTDVISFYREQTQTKPATKSWGVTTDSRLGLQLDIAFNEQFHITTQYIVRDHAGDFFEQNLEWAFLRWSPRSDIDIRVGRLGIDSYLLADYRDVGYAYPWMRPPHEFYAHIPGSHFDGFDISQHYNLGNSHLTLKLFAGYVHSSVPQSDTAINGATTGTSLTAVSGNWRAKISYAYIHVLSELIDANVVNTIKSPLLNIFFPDVDAIAPQLTTVNNQANYLAIGGSYDDGVWQLQAEAAYAATNSLFIASQATAYLSIARRFSEVTLFGLYGVAYSFQDKLEIPPPVTPSPELQKVHDIIEAYGNQNTTAEQSLSIGLRWDFYTNFAFKMQWSHYWLGSDLSPALWEPLRYGQTTPNNVNVWSVGVDFIF